MSYYSVDVFLLDAAILEAMKTQTYNPRRIDLRWSCFMASKSVLDTFLTVPLSNYHAIPYPMLCHVSFSLMNLFKHAFLEDPGWDLAYVRDTIKLESYFEILVSYHEAFKHVFGHTPNYRQSSGAVWNIIVRNFRLAIALKFQN